MGWHRIESTAARAAVVTACITTGLLTTGLVWRPILSAALWGIGAVIAFLLISFAAFRAQLS